MAARKKPEPEAEPQKPSLLRRLRFWTLRLLAGVAAFYAVLIVLFSFAPPPINIYQAQEAWRLGGIEKDGVSWDEIAPIMARSARQRSKTDAPSSPTTSMAAYCVALT